MTAHCHHPSSEICESDHVRRRFEFRFVLHVAWPARTDVQTRPANQRRRTSPAPRLFLMYSYGTVSMHLNSHVRALRNDIVASAKSLGAVVWFHLRVVWSLDFGTTPSQGPGPGNPHQFNSTFQLFQILMYSILVLVPRPAPPRPAPRQFLMYSIIALLVPRYRTPITRQVPPDCKKVGYLQLASGAGGGGAAAGRRQVFVQ